MNVSLLELNEVHVELLRRVVAELNEPLILVLREQLVRQLIELHQRKLLVSALDDQLELYVRLLVVGHLVHGWDRHAIRLLFNGHRTLYLSQIVLLLVHAQPHKGSLDSVLKEWLVNPLLYS